MSMDIQEVKKLSQVLTIKVKLNPTQEQTLMLKESSLEYISVINSLVSEMVGNKKTTKKRRRVLKPS